MGRRAAEGFIAALVTLAALLAAPASVVGEELPRPEYPQPQFQRERWLNLNSKWEFEYDDTNLGLDEGWMSGSKRFSRTILVPFCPESRQSGIGDTGFHPYVWYRRSVTVPPEWKGQRVLLRFGAVDYKAMVWLNGQFLGEHTGGHVPFRFDITGQLKPGANQLVVRAEDPPTDRYLPRGKQYWDLKPRDIWFTRTTGIWQTVWLEAVGASYFDGVRATPSLDGTVRFEARVSRAASDLEFVATIRDGRQPLTTATGRVEGSRSTAVAFVRDPRRWSPDRPNLYDVTFELRRGGAALDRVTSYFGFRSIEVHGGMVYLNAESLYLKMVLDQGYWPDTIMTPPSDEAIQFDIRLTKEMGFNGARKHQKVEDPRYLYWADRMGLLVSAEMPSAYVYDSTYAEHFTREWMEAIERDYNHPSIIIWAPMNESWGVDDLRDPLQQNHLKALYALTKSLDSTRLVIDNEGWEHTNMTDLMAIHDYIQTGEGLFARYQKLGQPGAEIPANLRAAILPGFNYNGSPVYLSEFGPFAYEPPGKPLPEFAQPELKGSVEEVMEQLRGLYGGIARIPAIRGICFTELYDVEHELGGLMTADRKPKTDPKRIRELNDMLR